MGLWLCDVCQPDPVFPRLWTRIRKPAPFRSATRQILSSPAIGLSLMFFPKQISEKPDTGCTTTNSTSSADPADSPPRNGPEQGELGRPSRQLHSMQNIAQLGMSVWTNGARTRGARQTSRQLRSAQVEEYSWHERAPCLVEVAVSRIGVGVEGNLCPSTGHKGFLLLESSTQ